MMPRPQRLTDQQRIRLQTLEPALRNAVRLGDYDTAKRTTADIQALLRPSGHETRLMQAKNWMFEAAMEAGQLEIASGGFRGIRAKMARTTRTYLEATALLAICHLRKNEIAEAEPLIAEVLRSDGNISSQRRRRQFRLRAIERFEQEAALAALRSDAQIVLDAEEVLERAGILLQTKTEDEIYADIGREVPPEVIKALLRVHDFAQRQLNPADVKYLPPGRTLTEKASLGRMITEATKRVVWRALCDPSNEVYKAWCSRGLLAMLDSKLLAAYLVTALSGMRVGAFMLAASLTALILRTGLDVFCEVAKPASLMIGQDEKP